MQKCIHVGNSVELTQNFKKFKKPTQKYLHGLCLELMKKQIYVVYSQEPTQNMSGLLTKIHAKCFI